MVLKSFYRKLSSKIYLIIFMLILTGLSTLFTLKDKYIEEFNKMYEDSFIYLESNDVIDFSSVDEVTSVNDCIKYGAFIVMPSEEDLGDDETIIKGSTKLDTITFEEGSITELKVKRIIETESVVLSIYVNDNVFNKMVNERGIKGYYIKINNFINEERITNELRDKYNCECFGFYTVVSDVDYEVLFNNVELYMNLLVILFVIISIISIYNIINDQKDIEFLYKHLGYTKKKVLINRLFNVGSLYLISLAGSYILTFIISIFI